jgi:group I intron endonuclease
MIGIYKITSPKNKIYIGQSVNIKKRFIQYKNLHKSIKAQSKLYRSFKKYGVENHKFEVLVECCKTQLHDLETYYQILHSVTNENGLNCFINNESSIDKIILKREKYINEKKLNDYYIENIDILNNCRKIIDDIL